MIRIPCQNCGNFHLHLLKCPRSFVPPGCPFWFSQALIDINAKCWRGGKWDYKKYEAFMDLLILEMEYRAAHGDQQIISLWGADSGTIGTSYTISTSYSSVNTFTY